MQAVLVFGRNAVGVCSDDEELDWCGGDGFDFNLLDWIHEYVYQSFLVYILTILLAGF